MDFGKLIVAVLKVVVCSVGFAIGVSLFLSISGHHVPELYEVWLWGGSLLGLCVGVCWAVERREVRIAFVLPTLAGLLVCVVLVVGSGPGFMLQDAIPAQITYSSSSWPPVHPLHMKVLLVGLLVGCVWALSRAGVFGTKPDEETPPAITAADDDVDVIEQIRELAALKGDGILTEGEFESKKQELLGRL